MDQQQQGYPPVGSVWERRNPDGSVECRRVTSADKNWVAYMVVGDDSVVNDLWNATTWAWNKWAQGHEPARMVEPPPPPIGSVWERHSKEGELIGRRRVVVPPPSAPLGWVAFVASGGVEMTPPECWHKWAADAANVGVDKGSLAEQVRFELLKLPVTIHTRDLDAAVSAICRLPRLHEAAQANRSDVAQANFEAAVEANRELSRKLHAADRLVEVIRGRLDDALVRADAAEAKLDAAERLAKALSDQLASERGSSAVARVEHAREKQQLRLERNRARQLLISIGAQIADARKGETLTKAAADDLDKIEDLWPSDLFTRKVD